MFILVRVYNSIVAILNEYIFNWDLARIQLKMWWVYTYKFEIIKWTYDEYNNDTGKNRRVE
jgi:hypothetical protein